MNEFIELIKKHPVTTVSIIISVGSFVVAVVSLRERKISAKDKITPFVFPIFRYISMYFKKEEQNHFIPSYLDEELKESRSYKRVSAICLNAHAFNYTGKWYFDEEEYLNILKRAYKNIEEMKGVDSLIIKDLKIKDNNLETVLVNKVRKEYRTLKPIPYFQINETKPVVSIPEYVLNIIGLVHLAWESGLDSSFTFPPLYYEQNYSDLRGKKIKNIFKVEFLDFYSLPFKDKEEGMEQFDLITTIFETTKQVKKLPRKFRHKSIAN